MNEQLTKIITHRVTVPVAVGLLSFGSGLAVGYFLGKNKKIKQEEEAVNQEIVDELEAIRARRLARENEERKASELSHPSTESEPEEVEPSVSGKPVSVPLIPAEEEAPVPVVSSVFAESGENWNYEEELEKRRRGGPYVLHVEEYESRETGFHQYACVYYEGDNTLVDEEEKPIYNFSVKLGELKFGHGSGDANVVYIRNVETQSEYEVFRHRGMYAIEVARLEYEEPVPENIQHAARRKLRE